MLSILILAIVINGLCGLQWLDTLPDKDVIHQCAGSDIRLPWSFHLEPGESIEDMKWLQQTKDDKQELALYSVGHFAPLFPFLGRVERLGQSGIVLRKVTGQEAGNYSLEVTTRHGSLQHFTRTVTVQVQDVVQTRSGVLHVTPQAVYDVSQGQWQLQLTCGTFSNLPEEQPPVTVRWTTPAGQMPESSSAEAGAFHLLLSSPPPHGNYSCILVDNNSPALSCLPQHSPLRESAFLHLDDVKVNFALVEGKRKMMVKDLEDDLLAKQKLLAGQEEKLKNESSELKQLMKAWSDKLASLQGAAVNYPVFHARLATTYRGSGTLKPYNILTNQGGAFNADTGVFTAPVDGTFFLIGSSGTAQSEATMDMSLMSDGAGEATRALVHQYTHYPSMGTCQALLGMRAGERAWLNSHGEEDSFDERITAFSGFLMIAGEQ